MLDYIERTATIIACRFDEGHAVSTLSPKGGTHAKHGSKYRLHFDAGATFACRLTGSRESARPSTINGLILSTKTRPNALSQHRYRHS